MMDTVQGREEKKSYRSPELYSYGSVQDITKSQAPRIGVNDNTGQGGMDKTG